MNQILMVEDKKVKTKKVKTKSLGPAEIGSIIRFFAITIILFGIFFIGQGSYAIYRESKGNNTENMPVINIQRVNDTIIVQADSINKINNFKYNWSNAEETVIPVEDYYVEETIILPNENSIIHFTIEDETGRAVKYKAQINVEGIDMTKPSIDLIEQTQGSIKIVAIDETEMAYITYKIDDTEEVKVDRSELEYKNISYILNFERGEHKLIVTAVDASGNIETIEKTVIVSELPDIQFGNQMGSALKLSMKDADGIKKVEINLNGAIYAQDNINQKELNLNIRLQQGDNIIKITVTNINGVSAEEARELSYEP